MTPCCPQPENLLLSKPAPDAILKLADFGLSTIVQPNELLQTNCGTLTYVAPEIVLGMGYGKEVDIWSLGVITFVLLCGYPPFYGDDESDLLNASTRGVFQFFEPEWSAISDDAKDLVRRMININRSARITAKEALQHPWFTREALMAPVNLCPMVGENIKTRVFNPRRKFKVSW